MLYNTCKYFFEKRENISDFCPKTSKNAVYKQANRATMKKPKNTFHTSLESLKKTEWNGDMERCSSPLQQGSVDRKKQATATDPLAILLSCPPNVSP